MDSTPKNQEDIGIISASKDLLGTLMSMGVFLAYVFSPFLVANILLFLILEDVSWLWKALLIILSITIYALNLRIRAFRSVYDEIRNLSSAIIFSFFIFSLFFSEAETIWFSIENFSEIFIGLLIFPFFQIGLVFLGLFLLLPIAKYYDKHLMKPPKRQASKSMIAFIFIFLSAYTVVVMTLTNPLAFDVNQRSGLFKLAFGGMAYIYADILLKPDKLKEHDSAG